MDAKGKEKATETVVNPVMDTKGKEKATDPITSPAVGIFDLYYKSRFQNIDEYNARCALMNLKKPYPPPVITKTPSGYCHPYELVGPTQENIRAYYGSHVDCKIANTEIHVSVLHCTACGKVIHFYEEHEWTFAKVHKGLEFLGAFLG